MSLVYTAPQLLQIMQCSWYGACACSLGAADVWARGRNVGWVACGWVDQHEPAGQGHLEAPVVRFVSFAVGLLVGASVLGCLG